MKSGQAAPTPSSDILTARWEPEYREALKQRQIWCKGTFATQKLCHNLIRVLRWRLETAEDHCFLSATNLNLKKMIRILDWRWKASFFWSANCTQTVNLSHLRREIPPPVTLIHGYAMNIDQSDIRLGICCVLQGHGILLLMKWKSHKPFPFEASMYVLPSAS